MHDPYSEIWVAKQPIYQKSSFDDEIPPGVARSPASPPHPNSSLICIEWQDLWITEVI